MQVDFFSIIGETDESAVVRAFLTNLDSEPEVSVFDEEGDDGECYFSYPDLGIEILFDSAMKVKTVFLYSGREEEKEQKQFAGKLPAEVSFEMSREDVRGLLGMPFSYKAEVFKVLGEFQNPWDKFQLELRTLHVRYNPDTTKIEQVSVG